MIKIDLHDSVAGRGGKFGGESPYNDRDVKLAKEYLEFMDHDPDAVLTSLCGGQRSMSHMLAEFAGFRGCDLRDELLIVKSEHPSTTHAKAFQWKERAEKAELALHRARKALVEGTEIKDADLDVGAPDPDLVQLSSTRKYKY